MVNILVVEDNIHYSKNLINILCNRNSRIRLYNMSTDGKEAIDIINNRKNDIDIILLDLKLPIYNGIDILNYIESNKLIEYTNSIIAISGEIDLMLQLRNSPYLYSFINKISGFENILIKVNELIEIKEQEKNSIEHKICIELKKLHYNFSYIGTRYLIETILLSYNNTDYEMLKLEKEIYPKLSKKYKKTVNNIKTNIINATTIMFYDCESSILENYFGISEDEKPTPKTVVSTIIGNLKNYN